MRLQPILAKAGIGDEGDVKREGALHLFEDDGFYLLALLWVDTEVQFIVYL